MKDIEKVENISQLFLDLEHRVRIIRSARIEATKRLKQNHKFTTTLTAIYSILITVIAICYSIVDLEEVIENESSVQGIIKIMNDYQEASVLILGLSSFITMMTLLLSNQGYGEKAARFQSNYMELTRLLSEIQAYIVEHDFQKGTEFMCRDDCNKKSHFEEYGKFAKRYSSLLAQSENHEDIDYNMAVVYEESEKEGKEAKVALAKEYIERMKKWDIFYKGVLILSLPLVIAILYLFKLIIPLFTSS